MTFDPLLIHLGKKIKGHGFDSYGEFTLKGKKVKDLSHIKFKKSDLGQHEIKYEGAFENEELTIVRGKWTIGKGENAQTDEFMIERVLVT